MGVDDYLDEALEDDNADEEDEEDNSRLSRNVSYIITFVFSN